MLSEDFEGVVIDTILKSLEDDEEPDFVDPRYCLVFWGRPTSAVKTLINRVQKELQSVAPSKLRNPGSHAQFPFRHMSS